MKTETNLMCFRLSAIINLDRWYIIKAFKYSLLHKLAIMKSQFFVQEITVLK